MLFTIILISAFAMTAPLSEFENQLQNSDPAVRRKAAESLCRMGTDAQPAAVALVRAMSDNDEETQQWASAALEELGPPDASALPTLVALVQSGDVEADTAFWAATLIGRLEADAASAVEPLTIAAEQHFSMPVRERAVWALGNIGQGASGAEEVLKKLAVGDQPRLARLAKAALAQISS